MSALRNWIALARWGCVAGLLVAVLGCQQEPGRWDQAQADSEGKNSQESSSGRLDQQDGEQESTDSEPPPFTPGESSGNQDPVTWTPKGSDQAGSGGKIDVAQLTSGDPLPGNEFNKFFPEQGGNYDMVAKQEKEGFAQYSLRRDGEEIAQLSVTDLRSNPAAATKFQEPDMMIAGHPAKKDGSKGTTLLIAGRFQVKVRSPGGNLNEADRISWLEKFDLSGISTLAN